MLKQNSTVGQPGMSVKLKCVDSIILQSSMSKSTSAPRVLDVRCEK